MRSNIFLGALCGALAAGAVFTSSAQAQVPQVPVGHPRVYVRATDLPAIQTKLSNPDFADEWDLVRNSSMPLCKAFVYLVTDNQTAGREAITEGLSALKLCDDARVLQNDMHYGACIYDWCYALLTQQEKDEFNAEFIRVAGLHSPWYPAENSSGVNTIVGHDTEGWLLTAQLPAGVAIYDESSAMYVAAAELFFGRYVEVRDFFYPAHMHHQGDSYIGARFQHDIAASWLFRRLGAGDALSREQQYVPYQLIYNLRPDGQQMRSGDTYDDQGKSRGKRFIAMAAGSYYNDPVLLYFSDLSIFWSKADWECVFELLFRPAGVATTSIDTLPLTKYFAEPMGEMVARTGWQGGVDSPDAVVHMRIGQYFFGNHQCKDFGTFQIYFRGPLAIASGVYEGDNSSYGSEHWLNYYHQTVAHNGLLIFDPSETMAKGAVNDGGEYWPNNGSDHPKNLPYLLDEGNGYKMGEVTAHSFGPDPAAPEYSYIAGDITDAYASQKVSLVTRSMVSLNTGNSTYPCVFISFDRITSTDASFRKTWLLHSIEEPQVNGRTVSVSRTGSEWQGLGVYSGKLVLSSLLPGNVVIDKIGGPGQDFWIESASTNYATYKDRPSAEPGVWRIEISPSAQALSDSFLNVIVTMDTTTALGPAVDTIDTADFAGAGTMDRIVLFSKTGDLSNSANFDIPGSGEKKTLICGLSSGTWQLSRDGMPVSSLTVSEEGACAYFTGSPGTYDISYGGQSGFYYKKDRKGGCSLGTASGDRDGHNFLYFFIPFLFLIMVITIIRRARMKSVPRTRLL
ncbi:MAG: heparinase II/III domain-containing protein [Planctomycetota bacterium]|jgi:hypothetical protein